MGAEEIMRKAKTCEGEKNPKSEKEMTKYRNFRIDGDASHSLF
jgi:hypothetical protein